MPTIRLEGVPQPANPDKLITKIAEMPIAARFFIFKVFQGSLN
jgi:hypothetical protein